MQIRRGVYSRAAFISLSASNCAAFIRGRRLFEGGVYSRKYGKCTFANNTDYLGSALAVTTEGAYNPFTSLPTSGHIHFVIKDTSFSNHQSPSESTVLPILNYNLTRASVTQAAVYLHRIINVTFTSCQYRNNNSTGLHPTYFWKARTSSRTTVEWGVVVLFSCTHTYTLG